MDPFLHLEELLPDPYSSGNSSKVSILPRNGTSHVFRYHKKFSTMYGVVYCSRWRRVCPCASHLRSLVLRVVCTSVYDLSWLQYIVGLYPIIFRGTAVSVLLAQLELRWQVVCQEQRVLLWTSPELVVLSSLWPECSNSASLCT